jgi:hypothetical protein
MLVLLVLVGLVINGVVAHLVGNLGKEKKIGYQTSFLVSFLLSPIIGILMVIASPVSDEEKVNKINNGELYGLLFVIIILISLFFI